MVFSIVGCRRAAPEDVQGRGEQVPATVVFSGAAIGPEKVDSVSVDAGMPEGGPGCTASTDPTVGVDAGTGSTCTGQIGQVTFPYALCACTSIEVSNMLTTDAFDSTKGAPDGGLGANIGSNSAVQWSTQSSIGGTLWTPGNVTVPAISVVRGDLHVGGTISASVPFTVDGDAFVAKTLPSNVKVLGKVSQVTSVASPCNCTNPIPIAAITAAHRSPNNDDATIGLSANAAVGNNQARIDLPCGNYYLAQVNANQPLTMAVHGHTALYVDGNFSASGALVVQLDPAATLDLFVAGTFNASNALTLGSQQEPAHCRAYVAGANFTVSGTATFGCNLYVPNALVTLANSTAFYGAVFAKTIQASGNATIHYDTSILRASTECCTATSCDDGNPCTVDSCNGDGTCSHTQVSNGTACSDGNACTQGDTCQSGTCAAGSPIACTASDACHTVGTCNPATGTCSNPAAANGTACNDGNGCTKTDTCQNGTCTGANPVTCTASDACHTVGTCNPATGTCSNPAAANGTACSDGNACTQGDTCQSGTCTGASSVACTASDACHTVGTCNPTTGTCSNPAAANGTACSDGNACTQGDTCQSGTCNPGSPVLCAPIDACHTSTCDSVTAQCTNSVIAGCTTGPNDQWTSLALGRPTPREGAVAAAVPAPNAFIVFGGENAGASLGDTWTWDRPSGLWSVSYTSGPGARTAAAVAYDSLRNRIVIFGGILRAPSGDTFLSDTWEYDPVQKAWSAGAVSSGPPARAYAMMSFDTARRKTVLLGGRGPTGPADTGSLWEWDGIQWTQRASTGGPQDRATSAMVFDTNRARFILFGGETAVSPAFGLPLADTWELDPAAATWTVKAPLASPPARLGHAMYFDSTRAKVVLFGGTSDATLGFADTWEYDSSATTWTQRVTSAGPSARAGHTFSFDSPTGHGLLAGGVLYSETGLHTPELDDVWEFDPIAGSWTPRQADAAPALYLPGAVYDTARSTLVLRGGETRPATWELSGGRWIPRDALLGQTADYGQGFSSDSRTGASFFGISANGSLVYDAGRARTLFIEQAVSIQAGFTPTSAAPGVWEWDGHQWTSRQCTGGPSTLQSASVAYDPARKRVIVAGGGPSLFSTWELDPSVCAWQQRNPSTQPPPRVGSMMTWDSARSVAVLFGGYQLSDTWEWDGAAGTWTQRVIANAPPSRGQGAMAYDAVRARTVLFGGGVSDEGPFLNDVWEYDGAAGHWQAITPAAAPEARLLPSMVYDSERGRIVMFGGAFPVAPTFSDNPRLTDLWDWDGTQWARRLLGTSPVARSGASGGWVPDLGIGILFGGVRGDGERAFLNDTWLWAGGEWVRASDARADLMPPPNTVSGGEEYLPAPRAGHALAFLPNQAFGLLFGGESDTGLMDDTWAWDENQFTWHLVTGGLLGPSARTGHAMAGIPGVGFLVFGGVDANGQLFSETDGQDSWLYSIVTGWGRTSIFEQPPARTELALATDPVRNKVVLFGGRGAAGVLQDTWEYDPVAETWTERTAPVSPPARFGHSMFYDPNRGTVIMLGGTGSDAATTFGDVWEWDGQAGQWLSVSAAPGLEPRAGALAFFDTTRGSQVVFGGLAYRKSGALVATFGDTWALSRANELSRNGLPCTSAATCGSGQCVDGFCCNRACTDQCAACNVAGSEGTCSAVSGAPRGTRTACASGVCAGLCNGSDTQACHTPAAGTICAPASCAGGIISAASTCDASGVCEPGPTTSCSPYRCSLSGGAACSTQCFADNGCADGAFCNACSPFNVNNCPSPETCFLPAQVGSFTILPTSTVSVNTRVGLSATASAGDNILYSFFFTGPNDQQSTFCSFALSPASCFFTATEVGTYSVGVTVQSKGQPFQQAPSAIGTLTVTP